jgi:hypothetical protein
LKYLSFRCLGLTHSCVWFHPYNRCRRRDTARRHVRGIADPACTRYQRRIAMSKYLLGWLLGVPVIVLVIIYLIFN